LKNYLVKRSKRKSIAIYVLANQQVEIRAPRYASDHEIAQFVSQKSTWIERKLAQFSSYHQIPEQQLTKDGYILLEGERIAICCQLAKACSVKLAEQQLLVELKQERQLAGQVDAWQRDYAKQRFTEKLAFWHQQFPMKLPNYSLKVRKMNRQWGNCNARGQITLSLRLIQYPVEAIDYVVVHELVHLKYMHHGHEFYRLLEAVLPNWKQQQQILSSGFAVN
jgi:predicted metal-dependent hydrolase